MWVPYHSLSLLSLNEALHETKDTVEGELDKSEVPPIPPEFLISKQPLLHRKVKGKGNENEEKSILKHHYQKLQSIQSGPQHYHLEAYGLFPKLTCECFSKHITVVW